MTHIQGPLATILFRKDSAMWYHPMSPARVTSIRAWAQAHTRQRVVRNMDSSSWAVCSLGVILGLVEYRDNDTYRFHGVVIVDSVSSNGHYVKVVIVYMGTGNVPYVDPTTRAQWRNASRYYRLADDLKEYGYIRKIQDLQESTDNAIRIARHEAKAETLKLSQNTITRALIHAFDHDYCQETAVALISAGHKMPDVTLSLRVTLNVSITVIGARNYYAIRNMFGETRGKMDGAKGLPVDGYAATDDLIHERIADGEFTVKGIEHTNTTAEWHTPSIRMLDKEEARALMEAQDE